MENWPRQLVHLPPPPYRRRSKEEEIRNGFRCASGDKNGKNAIIITNAAGFVFLANFKLCHFRLPPCFFRLTLLLWGRAGVRLPAYPLRWIAAFPLTRGRYPFLFTHDPLDTFAEFFERFAFSDKFQNRTEQGHCGVHFVHVLTSFRKGLYPCLTIRIILHDCMNIY